MIIKTNGQPRLLLDWDELTPHEREVRKDDDNDSSYIRYRGVVYSTADFMYTTIDGWDGIVFNTFDSGVLLRILPAYDDYVVMGRFW